MINLRKAREPLSYRLIARQLCAQFPEAEENALRVELARIGTEYAALLWDKPESNDGQIADSIINVSEKARELMDALIHLGPVARLHVYSKWLPDPEVQTGWAAYRQPQPAPPIDEPLRIKRRHWDSFTESPEITWLLQLWAMGEEGWPLLREKARQDKSSAKKPVDAAGQLLKDFCKELMTDLRKKSHEENYQYAVSYHGLARKLHEVVTGQKAGSQAFR